MHIDRIDHLVLTVADLDRTVAFYSTALGMDPVTFGDGRRALAFGRQKLNLHRAGAEFEPKANRPTPGSVDVCFIVAEPLDEVVRQLAAADVDIEEGPVQRTGATGSITSVYIRDPDANLIELSHYD